MNAAATRHLSLPDGLSPEPMRALAGLVADITGDARAAAEAPWLAPALLFSAPAVQERMDLPLPAPGEVLVHDYQAIRYDASPAFGAPLDATLAREANAGSTTYHFALAQGGQPAVRMETALRIVPAADIGAARPAAMRLEALRGATVSARFAVSQEQTDRYLALSGDRNPIHSDPAAARAMGLSAPAVPGLLLAALIQPAARAAAGDATLRTLKTRFLAPVEMGGRLQVAVQARGATGRLRAFLLGDGACALAIADLAFDAPG